MSKLYESLGIDRLTPKQRLDLIDEIWENLPDDEKIGDLPEWHIKLLEERLADAEANPGEGTPYEEALARIERQR
ncbi:MAG: addiction module protein [Gemmataceae bacterium]|nr:addiction module protein [Gemmataceae bacterium]